MSSYDPGQRQRGLNHSPDVYGSVTQDTLFTHGGVTYTARGLWSDDDGTIGVTLEDGTTMDTKLVFRGLNVFRCVKVQNLNGRTLEWFA